MEWLDMDENRISRVCLCLVAAVLGFVRFLGSAEAGIVPAWPSAQSAVPRQGSAVEGPTEDVTKRLSDFEQLISFNFEQNRFAEERDARAEYAAFLATVFGENDWHTVTQRLYHLSVKQICSLNEEGRSAIAKARKSGSDGGQLKNRRDYRAALVEFDDAFETYKRLLGRDDIWTIAMLVRIAEVQQSAGNFKEAKARWSEVVPLVKVLYGEQSPCYAQPLQSLGVCNLNLGLYEEAEAQLRRSLEIQKTTNGAESYEATIGYYHLARLYNCSGHFDKAEVEAKNAVSVLSRMLPEKYKEYLLIQWQLGKSCCEQGKYTDALAASGRAIQLMETLRTTPPNDVHAEILDVHAMSLRKLRRDEQAKPFEEKAKALRARSVAAKGQQAHAK